MGCRVSFTGEELKNLYWDRGMSTYDIARLRGCDMHVVLNYMKRFGIPRRDRDEASRMKLEIRVDFGRKRELAYVLGVVQGDGCIYNTANDFCVKLNVASRRFSESFVRALRRLGVHPRIFIRYAEENSNRQDMYLVNVYSRELYMWLRSMTVKRIEEFLDDDTGLIREFLRGFYESEGCLVCVSETCKKLLMFNSDAELAGLVKSLIEKLGFRASIRLWRKRNPSWKDCYVIRVLGGTAEVERFLGDIRPCIKNMPYKGRWKDNIGSEGR